jgi:hypothetical protein
MKHEQGVTKREFDIFPPWLEGKSLFNPLQFQIVTFYINT